MSGSWPVRRLLCCVALIALLASVEASSSSATAESAPFARPATVAPDSGRSANMQPSQLATTDSTPPTQSAALDALSVSLCAVFHVGVVAKTPSHPLYGVGDADCYAIDGVAAANISLRAGGTYAFQAMQLASDYAMYTHSPTRPPHTAYCFCAACG